MRQFVAAANGGDLQALMDLLAPDVVLLTDGGGLVKAALKPIHGLEKVLRFLSAVRPDDAVFEVGRANGGPALLLWWAGVLDTVTTLRLGEDRISELHVVRNPDKLTAMTGEPLRLTR